MQFRLLLSLALASAAPAARAQPASAAPPLPAGYTLTQGASEQPNLVVADLNQDGRPDSFAAVETTQGPQLLACLSAPAGRPARVLTHPYTDDLQCCSNVERKGNVLTVTSRGMRYFESYKFRYNPRLQDFELIGFDAESFGNAVHDGAGATSYNLLTGRLEAQYQRYDERLKDLRSRPAVRRVVPRPRVFTLSNFNQGLAFVQKPQAELNP